jgi:molybdopterin synthase catalytic subunit
MMFLLSPSPLDRSILLCELQGIDSKACVTVESWVHHQNGEKQVSMIEYETFQELAEQEGRRILQETLQRFEIAKIRAVHRIGRLEPGDLALWIGASAPSHDTAFAACHFVIDSLKQRVPIWKKEHYASGESCWIGYEEEPQFPLEMARE